MATYSTDLTTINDGASGTWVELTGTILGFTLSGAGGPGSETENFIQGIECRSQTTGKAQDAEISIAFDNGSGYSFATDEVVYAWLYYAVGVNLKTYANSGWMFVICDSLTTGDYFVIGGSDYGRNPYGGWTNVAVDPTATQSGTLGSGGNSGTYRYFGQVCNTIGEITKGNPSAVDAIRAGRGELSVTGTGGSFSELAEYNDYNAGATPPGTSSTSVDSGRHRLGIFQEQAGTYLFKGLLSFGLTATSVTFTDSNVTIIIDDCPHTYVAFNKIEVNNASSSVTWTNITITSTATTVNGAGYFEMIDNATVAFTGCSFNDFGTSIFLSNATILGCTYNSCEEITAGGASLVNCNILTPSVAADSHGLLWNTSGDPNGELDGMTFSKGTNAHHAIEFDATNSPTTITLTNIDFSGFHATNGNNDSALYFPSTSKSYTVNLIGCTGDISYKVGVGGSVTLVTNPATLSISGLVANTEVTIVKRGTAIDTGSDGATTSGSRNFVTTNAWTVNAYQGFLLEITSGSDAGRYYVYGNSATTLYLDESLSTTASSLTWALYDENDDTVAYHVENSSGDVEYVYSTGAGDLVDIITLHIDYQDLVIENYELLSSSATIPLSQTPDVNYYNPTDSTNPEWITSEFEVGLINPYTLVLQTDSVLDGSSVPATSAFTVSNNTVSSVSLGTATQVRLTLGTWIYEGDDTVTVSYTVPGSNQIKDNSGNLIAALTTQAVTNNTHMKVERVEDSGTSITIDATNYGEVIYCTAATAVTVTIPDTLSPVEGQTFSLCQWGAGQVEVTGSGTTTIVSTSATSHKTRERYSMLTLIHTGSNTDDWHCIGDLEDN